MSSKLLGFNFNVQRDLPQVGPVLRRRRCYGTGVRSWKARTTSTSSSSATSSTRASAASSTAAGPVQK